MTAFELVRDDDDAQLRGELRLDEVAELRRQLEREVPEGGCVDVSAITHADPSAIATLVGWSDGTSRLRGASDDTRALIELFDEARPAPPETDEAPGAFEALGRALVDGAVELRAAGAFAAELTSTAWAVVRHPSSLRWVDLPPLVQRTGAEGVGIVCLMSGLLGLVTGYQGAIQLQRFGASAFTANLVGLAMVRELAPLMTAIVVTGRSGAAFTAEIATMKVSEEIDALRTMGFREHAFLVLPRCIALGITVPLLTLIADVAAVLGAMAIATALIDSSALTFLMQTRKAVGLGDILAGLAKSMVYAQAIGLIGCFHGLRASGGAEGVGRRTTSTVVTCLVALVTIDAALTVLLHRLGV